MRKFLLRILLVWPVIFGFYWSPFAIAAEVKSDQEPAIDKTFTSKLLRSPTGAPLTLTDASINKTSPVMPLEQVSAASSSDSLAPMVLPQEQENVDSSDPMAQVTSVSQLKDVQPTDWAFEALQSLVERYGCIAGYPNGTYRGNRALTRYEFAAGLNACLDRVNELISCYASKFNKWHYLCF